MKPMRRSRNSEQFLTVWLLRHYGLQLQRIRHLRQQVYRLTDREGRNWIWKYYDEWEPLADQVALFQQLQERGFQRFAPFFPAKTGAYFLPYRQGYAVLMPWIAGREVRYRSWEQTEKALITLQEFHRSARGIHLPQQVGSHSFTLEGQWRERLRWLMKQEESGQLDSLLLPSLAPRFLEFKQHVLLEGQRFYRQFPHPLYQREKEKAVARRQVIHHDLAPHNLIEGPDGKIYMIDFDQVQYDLLLVDLNQVLERFLFAHRWLYRPAVQLLRMMKQVWGLTEQEMTLLLYSLHYPNFLLRTWAGYIQKRKGYDEQQLQMVTQSGYRHWQQRLQTLARLQEQLNAFASSPFFAYDRRKE